MTKNLKMQSELLSGWGRTNPVQCKVVKPINVAQIQELILNANPYSTITRGLGRSYGDAALLKDGTVIQIPSFGILLVYAMLLCCYRLTLALRLTVIIVAPYRPYSYFFLLFYFRDMSRSLYT